MIDCEYMSVKLCLTRALTCGPLHTSAASLDPQFSPLQALARLPQPNLFFFRFLKCKWQWRARSQLRDVKHALWTLWHSSANCFSRTYVHAVFKAALLNLSNTFCVRRAFRLKTHLAPWPYSFISRADVTFKCYQYLNSDVALTRASSQADTSAMFMSFTPRQVLWQYCLASNSPKI